MLQQKVGTGPFSEESIQKMQKAIDENDVDFTPLAMEFLKKLEDAIKDKNENVDRSLIVDPVMELKANAKIFHYNLVGDLANIMLNFLESIERIDKGAIEIVDAHHKTLKVIILKKIKGDGGTLGKTFISELKDACARYHSKRKKAV